MSDHRAMKVGLATQWFAPEPVNNPVWIAEALQSLGWDVSVVTGIPNYPSGRTQEPYRAYRRYLEDRMGMTVVRTPLYPSHDLSRVKRIINYLTFAASSSLWGQKVLSHSDVNLVYATPATVAIPAMLARRVRKVPYVLYVQDVWPDSIVDLGVVPQGRFGLLALRTLDWLVNVTYASAAHVLVISHGMKRLLVSRGIPEAKVSVVHNWASESPRPTQGVVSRVRSELGVSDQDILLMYAGNHGEAQSLDSWIEAIRRTCDLSNLRFVFIGDGSQKHSHMRLASDLPEGKLQFLAGVKPSDISGYLAASDAQIISLANRPIFRVTIPGKVQACLAMGKAIVASVTGDAAELLKTSGAALVTDSEDIPGIEDVIRTAHRYGRDGLKSSGDIGYHFYASSLSCAVGSRSLASVLAEAARLQS